MISITLLRIGKVQELQVENGSTVRDVFSLLKLSEEKFPGIYINGERRNPDATLEESDILGLFFPIRGEVTLKRNGQIWRAHKADPDDQFPSDFHAHNIAAPETLNLYTGVVYDARNRKYLKKLPKKVMQDFFHRLSECGVDEIQQKCSINKERFEFL
jgi:hypothetical protein